MKSKFFIIITVYNVGANLIKNCLLSIQHQKINKNIYLIVIND